MQRDDTWRSKLDQAAGWVIAGSALVAVIVITAALTDIANALGAGLLFVGLLIGGFLSTAAHEFGHAAAAALVGWRVWIISVLGVVHRRDHGVRLSTKFSQDVGGYVLASPMSGAHDSRWRSIAVSAGGPLASVFGATLACAWLFAVPRHNWEAPLSAGLLASLLAFGISSASAALMTLWPSRGLDGRPNDMTMILDSAFKREPSLDVRGVSWAWGLFEYGVEPDAWPDWMHESVARSANNPWSSPAAPLLAFFCALDRGDEGTVRQLAQRNRHEVGRLMRGYVSAYFDADAGTASAEASGVTVSAKEDSPRLLRDLVLARVAALNGDQAGAMRWFDAIAADINSAGPKPYWERLLRRCIRT